MIVLYREFAISVKKDDDTLPLDFTLDTTRTSLVVGLSETQPSAEETRMGERTCV